MGKRKRSALEIQLEESVRLAKLGQLPVQRDSLGDRLRALDGLDLPDALADDDETPAALSLLCSICGGVHPPDEDCDDE